MKTDRTRLGIFVCIVFFSTVVVQEPKASLEQARQLFEQAQQYYQAGDLAKAVEFHTKVIELSSDYTDAYLRRAIIYNGQKKYDLAIADLRKVN